MAATVVPAVRTKYSQQQMITAFVEAWIELFNEIPKKESVGVVWSQNSLETGGTASMWNNNVGNVKFSPSKNADDDNGKTYMMLSNVWEIIGGKKVFFQPPHPATWFKAFPTLKEGVKFHLDFLKNHRYKNSWTAVVGGDPAQFAHLLKTQRYYTAPEADYVRAMNIYFKKYMADSTFENVVAKYNSNQPVVNPEPTPAPTPEPIPEPTPAPTPAPINNTNAVIINSLKDTITNIWNFIKKK